MSFAALAWAAKQRTGGLASKSALLALANYADEHGCSYPSTAAIAEFGEMDHKTAVAALDRLAELGLIADTGDRAGRTKQIKVYRLALESIPKPEAIQNRKPSVSSAKAPQKRVTDTIRDTVPKKDKPSLDMRARDHFPSPVGVDRQVWRDFLASPKRRKAGMNQTAYAGICGNLTKLAEHGFPPGDMIALAVERGWTTVKLEWVLNDGRSNGMGGNRGSPGEARVITAGRRFVSRGSPAPGCP